MHHLGVSNPTPPDDSRRRASLPILLGVAVLATISVAGLIFVSCQGDDEPSSASTTTSSAHSAHGEDDTGSGSTAYGSHGMDPEVVTIDELAALGQGPAVGERFSGSFGLNVCGRFLDPPAAAASPDGWSIDDAGHFSVTPTDDANAGHAATIGDLMDLIGVTLSTGEVTFPDSTSPAQFQVATASVAVAGATFGPQSKCGDIDAKVQLWVYDANAVATGEDVRAVEVDPQDAPIIEDGMAFVVTVTPESSLPTLPPSALAG